MNKQPETTQPAASSRYLRSGTAAAALVVGLAALTLEAVEGSLVRDIQRYCTVCWKNAKLDPSVWEDCTQEVCCRLFGEARSGRLDLSRVLAEDSPERRVLARAIDMVRKRVQRTKRFLSLEDQTPGPLAQPASEADPLELAELLENARKETLSERQDKIIDLWTRGWNVPEIAKLLGMTAARVSDEKYKALKRLEKFLSTVLPEISGSRLKPGLV